MADRSGFLAGERGWQAVLAGALCVLLASVVVLVTRSGDPATADTYLSAAHDAAVVYANGRSAPASDGMRVPPGATVRTGADGGATLSTAGRDLYVGRLSSVQVVDGVRQSLLRGEAMVDSRNGPRLTLATPAGAVEVPDGSLARVEENALQTLRVGVFEGTARFTAAGRQATTTVRALYQTNVAYGDLAGHATPLHLWDDTWERRLAGNLVSADLDLLALRRGLVGTDGQLLLQSVSARLRSVPPASDDLGERALAVAVAQASSAPDPVRTLQQVQADRQAGGSWGVVAALVSARVSAVSAVLDTVLVQPGQSPSPVQAAGAGPDLGRLLGGGSSSPGSPTGGPVPVPRLSPTAGPTPTRTPSHGTGGTPPSTPSPVDTLVNTLTGLLSPSPSPPSTGASPSPTPILKLGSVTVG